MKRVTIDPITRLEGHGRIEIFLDEEGNVADAYFQVVELRGFEKFCEGRPAEELPRITPRICGVCPSAHHICSTRALDDLFKVDPPPAAKKLRELFYSAHMVHSHIAHFYALAAPDFVLGPEADPAERNILGVVAKVGLEIGGSVIKHRSYAQRIQEILGGRPTHSVMGLPGGVSRGLSKDEQKQIVEWAKSEVEFGKFSLKLFEDVVLANKGYVDLILSDGYTMKTHYMGLVDENNHVNFYDGMVRVVDVEGKETARFAARGTDYLSHIAEHVEPWTYLKFPYLKSKGWKGFVDGQDSGIYRVAPLARLNAADGMATPAAQEAYDKYFKTLGGKPVHATLANHWARLVELLYAAERLLELAEDPEITSPDIRTLPTEIPVEGAAVIEAPRGTLFHHYQTDEDGIIRGVNLIVATGNNHAAICMSVKKAAQAVIKNGEVREGLLNMVEMAFRAYDPCFGCATHSLPGEMSLVANIYSHTGELRETLRR
jgi:F420-non-reducing hydrogenase large subunit